jgi:cobalt-zinc-cadmium efflux system outer membrane protein
MFRTAAGLVLASMSVASACARPAPLIHYPLVPRAGDSRDREQQLPDPATQAQVSLEEILAFADRHSPAIAVARSKTTRGRAAEIAAAAPVPSEPVLSMSAGPRMNPNGTALDYGVAIEQQLEVGGQRGLRRKVAARARATDSRRLEEARWKVHLQVHTQFHVALVERQRVAVAKNLLAFSKGLLDIARKRLEAGDISALQVQVAEGEVALARQKQAAAEASYRAARLLLAELAGWPSNHPPEPRGRLDTPRTVENIAALVTRALTKHPSIRRLASNAEEADARTRLQDRLAWPNLTFGLAYSVESETMTTGVERQHVGILSLSIPLPLFRRNRRARANAHARLIVARAASGAARITVRARVRRSAAAVNDAAKQLESFARDILPKFEANLKKLARAFELGEVDVLEVLVARGRFLELEQNALSAYSDYFHALAELEAQVGGDVWPDEHDHEGGAK